MATPTPWLFFAPLILVSILFVVWGWCEGDSKHELLSKTLKVELTNRIVLNVVAVVWLVLGLCGYGIFRPVMGT